MIARLWSAHATPAAAPAYVAHLRTQVVPALRRVDGYAGAQLLQRTDGESVEIVVVTRWQSFDAIRGFAGPDLEEAVVADEAAALLTRFDPHVRHYEVLVEDNAD